MAVLFISPDAAKKTALVWAAVPDSLLKAFPSQALAKAALTELGGKGGGKGSLAQGQGTQIEKVPLAIEAATKIGQVKLAGWLALGCHFTAVDLDKTPAALTEFLGRTDRCPRQAVEAATNLAQVKLAI
ncbi:hypothetical protein WJX74_002476 [Apatococcus lobatus]|uniref:DHHA1 domain-containing protein n=1 Tax=Apatococcus lobatus TaxID=904363 RepID=A0AAW1RRX8_9CHLO